MKQNKNSLLGIGIAMVMLTVLVFYACQKEPLFETEGFMDERVRHISLDEFNTKVNNGTIYNNLSALFDLNMNSNVVNRTEDADSYWIETDEIAMIQGQDNTYFTFSVGDNTSNDEFYNLVVTVGQNGEITSTRIVEYLPSPEWLLDTSESFTGEIKIKANEIFSESDINNQLSGRSTGMCIQSITVVWSCNAGNNHPPDSCPAGGSEFVGVNISWGPCPPIIDAGDSTGGGISIPGGDSGSNDGTNGGGGTSGSNNAGNGDDEPDITDTTIMAPQRELTHQKKCEKLAALGNDTQIKQSFQDLHEKARNQSNHREFGYKYEPNQAPEELQLQNNNPNELETAYGGQVYGTSHTHQYEDFSGRKVYPMFSVKDLFNFGVTAAQYNNPSVQKDYSLFFHSLTVQKGTGSTTETYALKLNNWLDYLQFVNAYWGMSNSERRRLTRKLTREYNKVYKSNGGNIPSNYLKPLFKFMDAQGIKGVDLYRATNTDYTNWQKINYNAQTNNIENPTDCNN